MYSSRLAAALPEVRDRIAAAARSAGRDPAAVRLVAVTKGHPRAAVEAALEAGLRDLAENRLESLRGRVEAKIHPECRWHMVGHLQRRKAPEIRGLAHLLHSLDSLRLAERLERTAEDGDPPLPVLVQVNTSGEEAKGGLDPERVVDETGRILEMGSLEVRGLMTMAPFVDDEGALRRTFAGLREVQERLRSELPGWKGEELSMGMSNDYEHAVKEGSTMVRLGTVLFGERVR